MNPNNFGTSSTFGSSASSGFGTGSVFGSGNTTSSAQSVGTFGTVPSSSGGFGVSPTSAGFGTSMSGAFNTGFVNNPSGMGSSSTTGSSSFGESSFKSVFGSAMESNNTSASSEGFGFGGSGGGRNSSGFTSGFGTGTSASGFGVGPSSSGFGSTNSTGFGAGTSLSVFGTTGSSGFGAESTSSGFGNTHSARFGPAGLSGFNLGSSSSGFGATNSTAFGTAGSSGFGTGPSSTGFGIGPSPSGFGTGTSSSGFGVGTSSSVFGTNSAAPSIMGSSGFSVISGSSEFGTTRPTGFGAGSSGFGTAGSSGLSTGPGSSGFSTPSSASGFGVGIQGTFNTGSSGFGTQSSVQISAPQATSSSLFGGTPSSSAFGGSAQTGSSLFGSSTNQAKQSSVFGAKPQDGNEANNPFTGTSNQASTFGKTGGSVFGGNSSIKPPGLGGPSSIFSQPQASVNFMSSTGSSTFGASTTTANLSGQTMSNAFGGGTTQTQSGFGSFSKPSSSGSSASSLDRVPPPAYSSSPGNVFGASPPPSYTLSAAVSPAAGSSHFGALVIPGSSTTQSSVFGQFGTQVAGGAANTTTQSQHSDGLFPAASSMTGSSVFGGASRTADGPEKTDPKFLQTAVSGGSSSSFGGVNKTADQGLRTGAGQGFPFGAGSSASVFGGAGRSVVRQETADVPSSGSRPPLFPSAAAVSSSSTSFGGASHSITVTSSFPTGAEGGKVAGSVFGTTSSTVAEADKQPRNIFRRMTEGPPSGTKYLDKRQSESGGVRKVKRIPHQQAELGVGDGVEAKRGRLDPLPEDPIDERETPVHSSSSSPQQRRVRRQSSQLEDVSSRTSLALKSVPSDINKGGILRAHFSRFGKVVSVRCVPSKRCAYIQFDTHEQAARAKKQGGRLHGMNKPLTIFWRSMSEKSPNIGDQTSRPSTSSWTRPTAARHDEPSTSTGGTNISHKYSLPSSVAQELDSMMGGDSDMGEESKGQLAHARIVAVSANQRARKAQADVRMEGRSGRREERSVREASPSRPQTTSRRARSATPPPSVAESASRQLKLDAATISSLSKMIATTTMEKVNVLDTRDKLLRLKRGKHTGIQHQAFVGTCPDMCPEKERLYREEVRRLSLYEIIPGSSTATGSTSLVDHARAVKEYSRSSADQDEPLPHELRPLSVLTMTMNYLLSEIADLGEDGKWAEWYDFLWNRTRSIRKEITQQQLCSQAVVELIEKCVRFHIYCSERLCTEDMMVFDSKINNENLTKCLQTLKELYVDMERNHGLFCPNEAEFRAYIVLMNLNEGDTLREVQQLRAVVRDSREINFAVKAYSALNSNNYVRFFRLVKSASFLNACVLHRYFNQIRAQALRIIVRSYTAGNKKVGLPVQEFMHLLSFESQDDLREFCSFYGLSVDGRELGLDRAAFFEPESALPSWRSKDLVESKRMVSVGEVINGSRLDPVRRPPPQCSFDSQGRFIGSMEGLSEDSGPGPSQPTSEIVATANVPAAAPAAAAAATTPAPAAAMGTAQSAEQAEVSIEVIHSLARSLFGEVMDDHFRGIAQECIADLQAMLSAISVAASEVINSVTGSIAREVSNEVLELEKARRDKVEAAEKREREERAAVEKREREERTTSEITDTVISEFIEEHLSAMAEDIVRAAKAQERAERQERCVMSLHQEILDKMCVEMALQVADQVYQVDVVDRREILSTLQKAVELRRTAYWLAIWRKALKARMRQKRAMLDFPSTPPLQSVSQRLRDMYPDRPDHMSALAPGKPALFVNDRAQMTLQSPWEVEQSSLALTAHLTLASVVNSLQRTRAWKPLNLTALIRSPLIQRAQDWLQNEQHDFTPLGVPWKMLLSLPGKAEIGSEEEDEDEAPSRDVPCGLLPTMSQWLCAKFTQGEASESRTLTANQKTVLCQYSVPLGVVHHGTSSLHLGVCVRNIPEFAESAKNQLPKKEQGLMITKGTSAILFLLPHADTADDAKWQAAKLRLQRILEAKAPIPAVPIVFLLPCRPGVELLDTLTAKVTQRLGIQAMLDQDLLSSAAVVELPVKPRQPADVAVTAPVLQAQLTEAVKYLASLMPELPCLRGEKLVNVVEDKMTQYFFTPVLQDLRLRQKRGKLHQGPNAIIGLYNSLVDHIADMLTYPALEDISWPPPELLQAASSLEGIPKAEWNSRNHLSDVYELITNLRLPWFHYKDSTMTDWALVCNDVWAFVNSIVKKRCDSSVSLTSRISRLLARTCLQFENMCSLTINEDHCIPTYVNAPWTDIIIACVEFRLQRLHNWQEDEEEVGGNLGVFYDISSHDKELEFEPPEAWIQALLDTEDLESHKVEETLELAVIQHIIDHSGSTREDNLSNNNLQHYSAPSSGNVSVESVNQSNNRTLLTVAQEISELSENMRATLHSTQNLLLQVEGERQKSKAWNHYLEKALRGDTLADLDMSHILAATSLTSPRFLATPSSATAARQTSAAASAVSAFTAASTVPSGTRKLTPLTVHTPASTPASGAVRSPLLQETPHRLLPRPLQHRQLHQGARGLHDGKDDAENILKLGSESLHGNTDRQSLAESIGQFRENLQAQKRANELFEKRLESFLESLRT